MSAHKVTERDGVFTVEPAGTEFARHGYYHPMAWSTREPAEAVCAQADALYEAGFRVRVRSDTVWFARDLLCIDAPDGNGYIQVVDYRSIDVPSWSHLAVEVPSRRAMIFRLAELARFAVGEDEIAVARAHALAAAGTFAEGQPYTPAEMLEIERAEGNPSADDNFVERVR